MPTVVLDWTDQRSLVVHGTGDLVHVVVHPELSEAQIQAACSQLGDEGRAILASWREAIGLSRAR